MKKVIVLLALVAVGALVFAEDAPAPTYEFSASATGGWKYNLDNSRSTFINDWDLSLKYHLLNDLSKKKAGEEGTYGYIEVTHLNLNLIEQKEDGSDTMSMGSPLADTKYNNFGDVVLWGAGAGDGKGDNISVTAKIVSGPVEVGLYGAPGTNYENAKFVPLFEKDKNYDNALTMGDTQDSMLKATLDSAKGLSVKYTIGDLGFIQVASANTSWDSADPQYLFGANVQVKPVASETFTVTIDGGLWMNTDSKDMIFTGKAAVAAGDLSVSGAIDGQKVDASDILYFDAAANVAYALFEKKDSLNLDFYYANDELGGGDALTDLGLKFVDAEGLVPGLSFTVGLFWFDLLNTQEYDPKTIAFAESVSYKYALSDTTYVKPYQALRYDLDDTGAQPTFGITNVNDAIMYLNIGVEAQFFPNCVFTVDYFKGNKNKDNNENLVSNKDASEFAITAKVSL